MMSENCIAKNKYRDEFPILQTKTLQGKPLIYLDSANTTQKPRSVIDAIQHYYSYDNANIHRGVYELSERSTKLYEQVRRDVQMFIHAKHPHEIIFVRGATEGINLVAQSYGRSRFQPHDEIIISTLEHHSNIVPWQLLSEHYGTVLRVIPISNTGEIDLLQYQKLFSPRTKFVAVAHVSNALGTLNPIKQMAKIAHDHHVPILVDGAAAFPHLPVDVQELDCDFYVFSGHKAYGPTGVGVLYGKSRWLESMPPYQGGGDMIESVSFEKTTYNQLPYKFEAGTPNIAGVIAFGAALRFLRDISMERIAQHEQELLHYATEQLSIDRDIKIIGTAANKVGIISFVLNDIHPHDIATVLAHEGIAVRAGHHCAMPLMARFALSATVRISLGIYNQQADIDGLMLGLEKVKRLFS